MEVFPHRFIQRLRNVKQKHPVVKAGMPVGISASTENKEDETTMRQKKIILRKEVASMLKSLPSASIDTFSEELSCTVRQSAAFEQCTAVSVFLSMPAEVQTSHILKDLFSAGKRVYVPKVVGPNSEDMAMMHVRSFEELNSFPKNKWEIPEPPLEELASRSDDKRHDIDLVLVPGLAFDVACNRLGRGKGYYDCFLTSLNKSRMDRGLSPACTMGLAFDEQILEPNRIPVAAHDQSIQMVVTPSRLLVRSPSAGPCGTSDE